MFNKHLLIIQKIKNFGVKKLTLLFFVLLFSLIIRFYNLGKQSLWTDEAYSALFPQNSVPEMLKLMTGDAHPPLYYLIIHFLLYFGKSEFLVRLPSAVCSFLTIIVLFILSGGKENFCESITVSILFGFSSMALVISSMARMYSLQCLFTVLSVYFLKRSLCDEEKTIYTWAGYVFSSLVIIYTQYTSFIFLFSLNIYVLICRAYSKKYLYKWFISNLVIVLLYLPWLSTFLLQMAPGKDYGQVLPSPDMKIISDFFIFLLYGGTFSISTDLYPLVFIPAIILFLAGIYNYRKIEKWSFFFPGAMFLIPFFITLFISIFTSKKIFSEKHFFYAAPFLYIILARGFCYIKSRTKLIVIPLALLFLSLNFYSTYNKFFIEKYGHADWRNAVGNIEKLSCEGDIIFIQNTIQYFSFAYYYSGKLPVYTVLPDNVPLDIKNLSRTSRRIWLVRCQSWFCDPKELVRTWLDDNCKRKDSFIYYRIDRGSLITVDLYESSSYKASYK